MMDSVRRFVFQSRGEGSLTFVANFRLVSVSFMCPRSGLTMTNMRVFELPPREN